VLIPVCDESIIMLSNTIDSCNEIIGANKIVVIENSRDLENKYKVINACCRLGVEYISIPNLGNKARAINYWLKYHCNDEYVAIFDADQNPEKTFLIETMCFFGINDKVAIVQTPQDFRNENNSIISMMYTYMQKIFFTVISNSRSKIGFAGCFGTNFVFKVDALKKIGMFDENIITEDSATAYKLYQFGYEIRYIDKLLATGLAPISFSALNTQIKRYVTGNNQLLCKILTDMIFEFNWKNFYIYFCFMHSSMSYIISAAWLILCIFLFHNLIFSLIAINTFILLSFLSVLMIKSEKALLGIIFGILLTPLHLIHTVNYFGYSEYFKVTEKIE
jgi:cellulose synthase/poly-beta-1,6-N-acetylglucosamine synthase-like glycosyltransferase